MQASFVARHRALATKTVAGNAIAVTGAMHRAVISVILWLVTLPYPLVVVSSLAEAEAEARAFLRDSASATL